MSTIPKNRPTIDTGVALIAMQSKMLTDPYLDASALLGACRVGLLVIRMATPNVVYGRYDDTIARVYLDGTKPVLAINGNADPSRVGPSPLAHGKDEARIRPGVWTMIRGHHNDLPRCFRQQSKEQAHAIGLPKIFTDKRGDGEIVVDRMAKDGSISKTESGHWSTNFHPGGNHGTSSAGCLTAPPDQYDEIRDDLYVAMDEAEQPFLPIVLVLGPL